MHGIEKTIREFLAKMGVFEKGLLAHDEILTLIQEGVIVNADLACLNGSSLDIRLGNTFLFEQRPDINKGESVIVDYRARQTPLLSEVTVPDDGHIDLLPGQCVLAHSIEIFNFPNTLSAQYSCKSSMGRIFLNHMLAGWCDPGWNGSTLTLELVNTTQFHTIRLRPGDPIGQMKFFRHAEVPADKSYSVRGRYNKDKSVSSIKL